ncbi:acetylglutamate kinase [Psychrobium sp. 1_MG-2023]|uniref:acetylglutamate kinase n=1 Tax=Psychrobium sp. 1_MG-2023 TaxID=3062624 RepID=UPI0027348F46|nr:acetylglutamate kinase [Psychrobium sp. 1_MG-2023]MDP2561003.1 acetylglutamate kinase [Psychrobium sp. 1_MG-2023]
MKQPLVIKVGGALLESTSGQQALFTTIAQLTEQDIHVVLVHGGGCLVEEWLSQAGMQSEKLDGLRVTPQSQIDLVAGALAGAANKKLVACAKSTGLKTVGLSLADGDIVTSDYLDSRLGQVGQCQAHERSLLISLLASGFVPVISSIADDGAGNLLNVNADQAAQVIAQLLNAKLILLSDVPGVLDGDKQLISKLSPELAQQLVADDVIVGGMKVKVDTAFATANALGDSIVIASWQEPQQLLALVDGGVCGTLIESNAV